MTALADALAAAQTRVVAALAKSYVAGQSERDDVLAAFDAVGLRDSVDAETLLNAWDVIREHGAGAPAEQEPKRDEPTTDPQWKLIRSLASDKGYIVPDGPLTKAKASEVITSMQNGSYNSDDYCVPF